VMAAIAAKVGAERSVDSAFRVFDTEEVEQIAPLLQTIALPRSTRQAVRHRNGGKVLQEVRGTILDRLPDADIERENITRFGWRTVLTVVLGIFAAFLILTTFKTEEVIAAVSDANFW